MDFFLSILITWTMFYVFCLFVFWMRYITVFCYDSLQRGSRDLITTWLVCAKGRVKWVVPTVFRSHQRAMRAANPMICTVPLWRSVRAGNKRQANSSLGLVIKGRGDGRKSAKQSASIILTWSFGFEDIMVKQRRVRAHSCCTAVAPFCGGRRQTKVRFLLYVLFIIHIFNSISVSDCWMFGAIITQSLYI